MKYANQDLMDARVERIVRQKVKHYYTDWKNYDRIKYMRCKGNNDKHLILMVRECGTYLYTMEEFENYEFARTVYEYYMLQGNTNYYELDLTKLTVTKHTPNMSWLKKLEVAA